MINSILLRQDRTDDSFLAHPDRVSLENLSCRIVTVESHARDILIFDLSSHSCQCNSSDKLLLRQKEDNHVRNQHQHRHRHQEIPLYRSRIRQPILQQTESQRQRCVLRRVEIDEWSHEIVPTPDEGENHHSGKCGFGKRENHIPEDAKATCTIEYCRLI